MQLIAKLDRKAAVLTSIFVLSVLLFEFFLFHAYRTHVFSLWKYPETFLGTVNFYITFFLGYLVAGGLLWASVYLSLASPLAIRIIYWLFFVLVNLWEHTYQRLYERFSTTQDLSLAFITTSGQKIDAVVSYISWWALVPCAVYLFLILVYKSNKRLSFKQSVIALSCFALLLVVFNLTMWFVAPRYYFYEAWNDSYGAGSRTLFGHLFNRISYVPVEREKVEPLSADLIPQNNIVLVLDESMRGDHLGVNGYSRETTPFLSDLAARHLLKNWGIAASTSTRSAESFQYAITGFSPDDPVVDIIKKVRTSPTIFQYAKASNYKTFYFDGQGNDYWGGDPADLKYVDVMLGTKYFNPQDENEWQIDSKIAAKTNEIVSGSTGNFIVIFKRGNHTPYNRNFPVGAETWEPSSKSYAYNLLNQDLETFINTYDNAIKYNLETFFHSLVPDSGILPNQTVILYTSDHGQTLSENGSIYSHGGETVKEAVVPLIIIGNLGAEVDTTYKAMHANIFPTLLDLMNYPEDKRRQKYAVSLLKATAADSKERYFITPNVIQGDNPIHTTARIKFD